VFSWTKTLTWHIIKDERETCSIIDRYSLMTLLPILFNGKAIPCGAAERIFPKLLFPFSLPPPLALLASRIQLVTLPLPISWLCSPFPASGGGQRGHPIYARSGAVMRRRQSGRRLPRQGSSSPTPDELLRQSLSSLHHRTISYQAIRISLLFSSAPVSGK
jgi:hypothetical protein